MELELWPSWHITMAFSSPCSCALVEVQWPWLHLHSSPEQRGIFLTQTIMSLRNVSPPDESNTVQFQNCCYKPSDLWDAVYVSPDAAWLGPQQWFQGERRSSFSFSSFQEPLGFCDFLSEPLVSDEWRAMASSWCLGHHWFYFQKFLWLSHLHECLVKLQRLYPMKWTLLSLSGGLTLLAFLGWLWQGILWRESIS